MEDFLHFGSLKILIGEAGEASHARDNRMKWGTLRGRKQTAGDRYNTWEMMLRNFYALKSLSADGVLEKFVSVSHFFFLF